MSRYLIFGLILVLAGCSTGVPGDGGKEAKTRLDATITRERAKLDEADRLLVEAQEWCVVANNQRLGSMGAPVKLTLEGQTVFLCCQKCTKKAESDPKRTLAKLDELKAKKRGETQR